ncbi:MAG: nitroreductase/quinone reductase family protein [Acidimicrobiia bacterium]
MSNLTDAADDDYCYLTTTGRVSGRPHEIEIWFAVHENSLFMLAGAGTRSDWVRNTQEHPSVSVRVRDLTHVARGRVISDATEQRLARTMLFDKYEPRNPGLTGWRESALPMAFDVDLDE